MFSNGSEALLREAVFGMRLCLLALSLEGVSMLSRGYFQALGETKVAVKIATCTQFAKIGILILMPLFFGLTGAWLATPITQAIVFPFIGILLYKDIKKRLDC